MAADAQRLVPRLPSHVDLPDELIANILLQSSTPTFIQLTRTSNQLRQIARTSREILLHHLNQVPGDKSIFDDTSIENEKLFLLLRQRAANHLYGVNFTANMHEHLIRNAQLDPSASSVSGLDADYVRMTLVYKDSQMLNMYTNHCSMKERIEGNFGRDVKILKLVQWTRWVSCLVSWRKEEAEEEEDFSESESETDESETEMLDRTGFKPTANTQLADFCFSHQEAKTRSSKKQKMAGNGYEYRVVHFDVYTIEDSQTFIIEPYHHYVPRDFAVFSTTNCAVLWDRNTPKGRPTEDATVVVYTTTKAQLLYPVKYEEKVVWPKTGKPERVNADSDDDDSPEYLPERIGFFKDGRRIKLYDSGSVVPYEVTSATTTQYDQYASSNVIRFDGFQFSVDTPFFGTHATYWDEMSQHSFCFQTHLCLGMSTLDIGDDEDEDEVRVLCILRSQTRLYPENCEHRISLQRMTHVSAANSTVVARLWGFEELHTNLTGKETVAISPGGTRIAIAMWNKVYVYPINPKVLCEDVVVDSSDDEAKPKKKKKKAKKPWVSTTVNYYKRKKDRHLSGWRIAEIRPIVLDLNGAVAHKMNWSAAKGPITDTYVPEPVVVVKDEQVPELVIVEEGSAQVLHEDIPPEANGDAVLIEIDNASDPTVASAGNPEAQTQAMANGIEATSVAEEALEPSNTEQQPSSSQAEVGQQTATEVQKTGSSVEENQKSAAVSSEAASAGASPSSLVPPTPTSMPVGEDNAQVTSPPVKVATPPTPPAILSSTPTINGIPFLASSALPTTNSLTHFNPYSIINLAQPAKPSPKRKEKVPEVTNSEIIVPTGLEKEKYQQTPPLDPRSNSDFSPPPSPVSSKAMPKPKQTVSEALSAPTTPPQPQPAVEPVTTAVPTTTVKAPDTKPQLEAFPSQPQASTEIAPQEPEQIPEDQAALASEPEVAVTDLSKTSTTTAAGPSASSSSTPTPATDELTKDKEAEKAPKRKKRITEDELIILTDRGVQVWNVGARAKGKRKQSILPLEESLKGRLPRRKAKAKAKTVVDESDEGDVD